MNLDSISFTPYIDYQDLLLTIEKNSIVADLDKINKAFEFTKQKHQNQFRKTGHPYYVHPLAVANIVAQLHLDETSIIASLLHDVVEDTGTEIEEIQELFGNEVAQIVSGVTKFRNIKYKSDELQQTENLRKLFLALSKDIRVLIIKICDRLHNMLTIDGVKNRKKKRAKAIETLEIYAPLAHRIGLYKIKDMLEDICFEVINSRAKTFVLKKIDNILTSVSNDYLNAQIQDIKSILDKEGMEYVIQYRQKTPYSIWRKMENKNRLFENIFDIFGYRIITNSDKNCYHILNIIHSIHRFTPNSFMDYISSPKQNGYQSLHTSVLNSKGIVMEFQIRTAKMQYEAEFGIASHWAYKIDKDGTIKKEFQIKWIDQILNILNSKTPVNEILEYTKLEINNDNVFVFTKDGDIIHLPIGATILDFVFHVLPSRGYYFSKVIINNIEISNLGHELHNGDKISILFSDTITVNQEWLKYVTTGNAKIAIKKGLEYETKLDTAAKGLAILKRACNMRGILFNDNVVELVKSNLEEANETDMYIKFFHGQINPMSIIDKIFNVQDSVKTSENRSIYHHQREQKTLVYLENIPNLRCVISSCCGNIEFPSDIKLLIDKNGAFIHKPDCKAISNIATINSNIVNIKMANIKHDTLNFSFIVSMKPESEVDFLNFTKKYKFELMKKDIFYENGNANLLSMKMQTRSPDELQMLLTAQDKINISNLDIKVLDR